MEKLVRNDYPEIIKWKWQECEFRVAGTKEKLSRLLDKIVEEGLEVQKSKNDNELQSELWDVLDVIDEICASKWFNMSDIDNLRKNKTKEKWWFDKWIVLTID
jgi:predicted house-cleaning noncanonical NTP pyrophosphatase (MazG superfamily)